MYTSITTRAPKTIDHVQRVQETLAHDEAVRTACASLSGTIHRHDDGEGFYADCPTCEASGYVNEHVCRDCLGLGDQYATTIADLVEIMSSL